MKSCVVLHRLIDEILSLDDQIRFVGIINNKENTFTIKHNDNIISLLSSEEEEQFALSLYKIKNLQDSFDEILGKTKVIQIRRQLITQIVYFVERFIIYATFNPFIEEEDLAAISDKIHAAIKRAIIVPEQVLQQKR